MYGNTYGIWRKKCGKIQALQIVSIVSSVSVENNNFKNKLKNNRFPDEGAVEIQA